jgi:hypothetical protein
MPLDAAPERGIYRHFKGRKYELLWVARHSETEELLVVYRPLDGDGDAWVRPLEMFVGAVKVGQSEVPRFERISSPSPGLLESVQRRLSRAMRAALRGTRRVGAA